MSSSQGGDGRQDEKEVPEHPDGNNYNAAEDKKSSSEVNKKEKDVVENVPLVRCASATKSPHLTVVKELEEMLQT